MFKLILLSLVILGLNGCTDARIKQLTVLGTPGTIVCYSGTLKIYEGKSTGKIASESGSDGWFLEEEGTHNLIRVSGACVIKN